MKRIKMMLSLLLAAALPLGLAACGKETEKEPDRYGGIRYIPAFQTVDTDLDELRGGCIMGDYVYLAGSVTINEDYFDKESRLLRVPLEGGEAETLAGWAASGILDDLWPWIDLDRDIDREDLMFRVLEADSINGGLYEISDSFYFRTAAGARDAVGDRMAWTVEDVWAALEDMPEGCIAMPYDREWMLREMLTAFWDRLVDWESGTCRFDGEEFRRMLAFCGRFPEEGVSYSEWADMLRDRELMVQCFYLGSFWNLQTLRTELRDDPVFVGLPDPWGGTGSCFQLNGGLAMTSAGKNKAGAWTFMRTLLLPHKQDRWLSRFPINKEAFEEMAWEANTSRYGYSDSSGRFHSYRETTREEYDRVMALYEAVDSVGRWDDRLGEIILEISGAYFAGDKTLDETAELIQNRANLYLSEQN